MMIMNLFLNLNFLNKNNGQGILLLIKKYVNNRVYIVNNRGKISN